MIKVLLGIVICLGLHYAWCKWGNKCDCELPNWRDKK